MIRQDLVPQLGGKAEDRCQEQNAGNQKKKKGASEGEEEEWGFSDSPGLCGRKEDGIAESCSL